MKKISILLLASALTLTNADLQQGIHHGQEGAYYATHKLEERLHEGGHTLQEGVQKTGNRLDETFEKGQHRTDELIDRISLGLESARDYVHHKVGDSNILSRGADSIKHTYDAAGNLIKEGLNRAEEGLHLGGHKTGEAYQETKNTVDEKLEGGKHRGEELGYRAGHRIEETADRAKAAVGDAIDSINAGLHLGHRHGGVLGTARDAVEGVYEGVHGAASRVKEGVYDTAESVREHIPGLHKPTIGDKISDAYENVKDKIPGQHKESFGEKITGAYENLKEHLPGQHKETLGDKFHDAIDRAREYIPEAHKPTIGEKISSAYENLKEHLPGHHHHEDPNLKEKIKEELSSRAEQAVSAAKGYKASFEKDSESIRERAGKLYDRIFSKEEPEPVKEPTFTEKISQTIHKIFSSITGGEAEPEEPPKEPTLKERATDAIHHVQEGLTSKLHKEGKEDEQQIPEELKPHGFREKVADSLHHAHEKVFEGVDAAKSHIPHRHHHEGQEGQNADQDKDL